MSLTLKSDPFSRAAASKLAKISALCQPHGQPLMGLLQNYVHAVLKVAAVPFAVSK